MNHPWQQPIRPLSVFVPGVEHELLVLFIRPRSPRGWEVIVESGNVWTNDDAQIAQNKAYMEAVQ